MNYKETLDFLFSQLPAYHRIGKAAYKNDLNNTLLLDNYFNKPHRKFRTIHVAGTNGKGSVSHMIASILQEAGYKTGLYTSPHLKDFRERIKINGIMIPESEVISFVEGNKDILESVSPSFFEMTVAIAFNFFAEKEVDVAVIEVGLGGRLDSTNIIIPALSIITNIGHDHMDLLGDTIGKVAVEKAGIIKDKIPVVISETQIETKDIFTERAAACTSEIIFADSGWKCELNLDFNQEGRRKYSITELSDNLQYSGESELGGNYQNKNIQAVFAAFSILKRTFSISEENIISGIGKVVTNTGLEGRWQVLGKSPLIICDTGHNKEGLEYVLEQISDISFSSLHIILGFVNDKDLTTVLPLFPVTAKYYFTKASVPRALNEEVLRLEASKSGLYGESFPTVKDALASAKSNTEKSDLIFIGGSTFIVAEVV
jgi:dihydrofolate synthase / folylpolyglutamate synthase